MSLTIRSPYLPSGALAVWTFALGIKVIFELGLFVVFAQGSRADRMLFESPEIETQCVAVRKIQTVHAREIEDLQNGHSDKSGAMEPHKLLDACGLQFTCAVNDRCGIVDAERLGYMLRREAVDEDGIWIRPRGLWRLLAAGLQFFVGWVPVAGKIKSASWVVDPVVTPEVEPDGNGEVVLGKVR